MKKVLYYIFDEIILTGLLATSILSGFLAWVVVWGEPVSEIMDGIRVLDWEANAWFMVGMVTFPFWLWVHLSDLIKSVWVAVRK